MNMLKQAFKENAKRDYKETVKMVNMIEAPTLKQLFSSWLKEM